MRLAVVYEKFIARGGLERYVFELTRRLAEVHDVSVITTRHDSTTSQAPVRFVKVNRPLSSLWNLIHFNYRSARLAARLDVDATLGFGRTTRQTLHRAGGGCHAVFSRLLPATKRYGLKNLIELQLERQLYRGGGTTRFVFNSQMVAKQVQAEYGVDPSRIDVLHTPVDCSHYSPAPVEERRAARLRYGISDDQPVFLFASLNHLRKGLPTLLDAWPRVPATLLVAGEGLSPATHAIIRELGFGDRLLIRGADEDLSALCKLADFFIHPTRYDACANTVLQAMACGLVVLVSERDGAIEHIRHEENGFILHNPTSPDAVEELCLHALRFSPERRQAIGAAARASMQGLTWDRHLCEWERIIAKAREAIL